MRVEISMEDLTTLQGLATVGKLMNGLVHNLNGPLQNIGMDLEMMIHMLAHKGKGKEDPASNMETRLRRMEKEFDAVNLLIRATAARGNWDEENHAFLNMGDFLEQELSFLKANLYFKHNVQKEEELAEGLPSYNAFPGTVPVALGWFIHALVEELEKQEIKELKLKAGSTEKAMEIEFLMAGGIPSETFMEVLNLDLPPAGTLVIGEGDAGLTISVALLKSEGASITCDTVKSGTRIGLVLPVSGAGGTT